MGRNLGPGVVVDGGHAPLDPTKSCDDEDYEASDKVTFKIRLFPSLRPEPSNVGYAMHQSCWQLLHRHAQARGVDDLTNIQYTKFLFHLHNSTLDGSGRDWAGDYGGLLGATGKGFCSCFFDTSSSAALCSSISTQAKSTFPQHMMLHSTLLISRRYPCLSKKHRPRQFDQWKKHRFLDKNDRLKGRACVPELRTQLFSALFPSRSSS